MRAKLGLAAGLAALAACTQTPPPKLAATPPPATAAAQNCVALTSIRESRVVSDQVIDFYMNDGRVLRNTLPFQCSGLGIQRAFSYATSLNQLCNVDTITVIIQGGGPIRGATCGLGMFTPYTPAAKPASTKP